MLGSRLLIHRGVGEILRIVSYVGLAPGNEYHAHIVTGSVALVHVSVKVDNVNDVVMGVQVLEQFHVLGLHSTIAHILGVSADDDGGTPVVLHGGKGIDSHQSLQTADLRPAAVKLLLLRTSEWRISGYHVVGLGLEWQCSVLIGNLAIRHCAQIHQSALVNVVHVPQDGGEADCQSSIACARLQSFIWGLAVSQEPVHNVTEWCRCGVLLMGYTCRVAGVEARLRLIQLHDHVVALTNGI